MQVHYDEKADAVYIRFKEARYNESDEVQEGIILDYDRKGHVIGIEILDASSYLKPDELASMHFEVFRAPHAQKKKVVHQ